MSNNTVVIVGVVTNILSVVGIVICNKYITEVDGYNFMVFLSFLHFAFTMLGTRVLMMMNMFSYTPAPLSGVLPVAIGSLLSVAFMNLNLSNNSVGFYQVIYVSMTPYSPLNVWQLSKLACIPCTLLVQYVAYKQSVSRSVQLTLIPISFGVGYATVYDLNLNTVGFGERSNLYSVLLSFKLLCSVRYVRCGGHLPGADLHKHVSEITGLQRTAASVPHHAVHHNCEFKQVVLSNSAIVISLFRRACWSCVPSLTTSTPWPPSSTRRPVSSASVRALETAVCFCLL